MAKKTTKTASINFSEIRVTVQRIIDPIAKHSTVIMAVAAISVLIYSMITVSMIITVQDDVAYRQAQSQNRISGAFDKTTINKVNNLKASSDGSSIDLPSGRRNPFVN